MSAAVSKGCKQQRDVLYFPCLCAEGSHQAMGEGKEEREGEGEGTTPKIKTKRLKYPVLFILEHGESLQNCVSKR